MGITLWIYESEGMMEISEINCALYTVEMDFISVVAAVCWMNCDVLIFGIDLVYQICGIRIDTSNNLLIPSHMIDILNVHS